MSRFLEKVREEIKRRLSEILEFETRDPRLEMVTVIDVEVTKDLQHAKVFVSAAASETPEDEVLTVLKQDAGFLRTELASRLDIKRTPELHFHLDPVEKQAERIDRLLDETDLDD